MRNILYTLLILNLTSCAFITNKLDYWMPNHDDKLALSAAASSKTTSINYCPINKQTNSSTQILVENNDVLKFYKSFYPNIFGNKQFSFVEKSIMLSLIELMRRPDSIGPQSRFQIFLRHNNENYYFDFRPRNKDLKDSQSLMIGLNYLNTIFNNKKDLKSLANSLDNLAPKDFIVSSEFEDFLKKNQGFINKNDFFYENFFKGDEVITHFETFKRGNFSSLVSSYMNHPTQNLNLYKFDEKEIFNQKSYLQCNFNVVDEMSYLKDQSNTENRQSHYMGYEEGNNVFLAVASFDIDDKYTQLDKNYYFFNATASTKPYPMCRIKNDLVDMTLFSVKGRNPEQFMQHLISYEIDKAQGHEEINQIVNFSRHLFLSNPDRILYESKKGRSSQLNFFLTMNFPIYHAESLGNIFGQAKIIKDYKTYQSLHSDSRTNAEIWCQ